MKLEQQLHDLRLQGMMKRWESLKESKQLQGLSLLEGFGLLLQAESELRYNRKKEKVNQTGQLPLSGQFE